MENEVTLIGALANAFLLTGKRRKGRHREKEGKRDSCVALLF